MSHTYFSNIGVTPSNPLLYGALVAAGAEVLTGSGEAKLVKVPEGNGDRLERVLRAVAPYYQRHNRPLPGFSDEGGTPVGGLLGGFI